MNPTDQYIEDARKQAEKNKLDIPLASIRHQFEWEAIRAQQMKAFTWMGVPILQFPSDLVAIQELIWNIKPDFIIETGVAFGGMTVFYASILDAMDHGEVIGIDIDIREHNKRALTDHPLFWRMKLLSGLSSTDPETIAQVRTWVDGKTVFVSLDSNHTHDHVLAELRLYAPMVPVGSYIVVFDTGIEFFHDVIEQDRPWGKGNNPYTAVRDYLKENDDFAIDLEPQMKALITSAPCGFLRRVK